MTGRCVVVTLCPGQSNQGKIGINKGALPLIEEHSAAEGVNDGRGPPDVVVPGLEMWVEGVN